MLICQNCIPDLINAIIAEIGIRKGKSLKINKKSIEGKTVFDLLSERNKHSNNDKFKEGMKKLVELPEFKKLKKVDQAKI